MPQQIDVPGMGVVEFPDSMSDAEITAAIQKNLGSPAPSSSGGSSVAGVGKSLATGLAQGAIGIAGLPGDLLNLGARALGDKTLGSSFGSEAIQKQIEGYTGEFYKPQGRAESIANTTGQFLPAMAGGPEGLAAKFATRAVAPALASEAAGAASGDNPYARAAGALAGAVAGPAAYNQAIRAMRPATQEATLAEIKSAANAAYQHQDVKNVRFTAAPANDLADNITTDLRGAGFRPNLPESGASVFKIVDELRNASSVDDLLAVRQALKTISDNTDALGRMTPSGTAAVKATRKIDDFLPNIPQAEVIAGDAQKANSILNEAKQNWGSFARADEVRKLAGNAEINAASANSGANIQNATKQAFKTLLKNDASRAYGYSPEELAALNKIVRGTWTGDIARAAGNLLGGGGGLGMLASGAAGYSAGGVPGAIAAGLAGRGLKKIADRTTLKAVADLDRLLRSRSPEALKVAAANPQVVQLLPPKSVRRLQAAIAADPVLTQRLQSVPADSQ